MQNRRLQYRLFSYGVINASKSLPISFVQNEELFVFLRNTYHETTAVFYSIRFTQPFLQELGFKYMKLEDDGEIGTSKNAQRFLNNMQCPLLILFVYVEVIHGITVS